MIRLGSKVAYNETGRGARRPIVGVVVEIVKGAELQSWHEMTAWREVARMFARQKRARKSEDDEESSVLYPVPTIFVARCSECQNLLECEGCRKRKALDRATSLPDESGVWV
jgi:hypothetical protein